MLSVKVNIYSKDFDQSAKDGKPMTTHRNRINLSHLRSLCFVFILINFPIRQYSTHVNTPSFSVDESKN